MTSADDKQARFKEAADREAIRDGSNAFTSGACPGGAAQRPESPSGADKVAGATPRIYHSAKDKSDHDIWTMSAQALILDQLDRIAKLSDVLARTRVLMAHLDASLVPDEEWQFRNAIVAVNDAIKEADNHG